MTHKKVLILSSLAFPIVTAVILPRFFEDLPLVETPSQAMAQVSTQNVPSDFNWKIYIQNYEDLRRAGDRHGREGETALVGMGKR